MSERKYTAADIDSMRRSILMMIPVGQPFQSSEIEDQLRTYLSNDVDPEELARQAGHVADLHRKADESLRRQIRKENVERRWSSGRKGARKKK